jgi:hypothetical protein
MMAVRDENLRCVNQILDALDESLGVVVEELMKCKARVEHIRRGVHVEAQLGRTVDPLKAPEVVGANKDGDGGFAFTLDVDDE